MKLDLQNLTPLQLAMFGAMMGDALGVPHEFKVDHAIDPYFVDHPTKITKEYKTYGVPLGVYSDDFSQQLCVYNNFKDKPSHPEPFYDDLLFWQRGKYWVNAQKFDEGMQTQSQLNYYSRKREVKIHDEFMSGNGSLMRVLPIAFLTDDLEQMKLWAFQCSVITHNSEETIKSCQFYTVLARLLAQEKLAKKHSGAARKEAFSATWDQVAEILDWKPRSSKPNLGSGYVIDTMLTLHDCIMFADDYAGAVKRAILYGEDTDTSACVVGGIAALVFGLEDLPSEWIEFIQPSLENRYVDELFPEIIEEVTHE